MLVCLADNVFMNSCSENHTENVSASMQTIMTLVLDESEDISQQLLSVLLTSLRREKRVYFISTFCGVSLL
jgi:sister-chromatid-cohesion protein PDS5